MTHKMKLRPHPFFMIKSGLKTIELRLYDEKRQQLQVGDTLLFANTETEEELSAKIAALHRFESFKELYSALPLEKCGYLPEEIETASYKDMEEYYSKEEQGKYGVVGIELILQ